MRIERGGANVSVAQQFLYSADVANADPRAAPVNGSATIHSRRIPTMSQANVARDSLVVSNGNRFCVANGSNVDSLGRDVRSAVPPCWRFADHPCDGLRCSRSLPDTASLSMPALCHDTDQNRLRLARPIWQ
jgi:hypothetical protein